MCYPEYKWNVAAIRFLFSSWKELEKSEKACNPDVVVVGFYDAL